MWTPIEPVLDLLFPPVCAVCGGDVRRGEKETPSLMIWRGHGICRGCLDKISWLSPPFCPRCAMPIRSAAIPSHLCGQCLETPPPFESALALLVYGEEVFPLMHRMKYGPDASLARYMGVLLARYLGERLSRLGLHAVVPVPLHRLRLRERGFNQAANMGKAVAKSLGVELETDILLRVRATPAQVGLSRSQRIDNVKGAFGVSSSNRARKRNLLLVDDVYTTGATLAEAARALLRAGAREVHVLTFARVP